MDNSKNIIIDEQISKLKEVIVSLEQNCKTDVEDELNFLNVVCNKLKERIGQ